MKPKSTTKAARLPLIPPGQILIEEFLRPMGITQYRLAVVTGLPHSRVTAIIKGERGITADTAMRFSKALGTSAEFWLNLQSRYDLEKIMRGDESTYANIERLVTA